MADPVKVQAMSDAYRAAKAEEEAAALEYAAATTSQRAALERLEGAQQRSRDARSALLTAAEE